MSKRKVKKNVKWILCLIVAIPIFLIVLFSFSSSEESGIAYLKKQAQTEVDSLIKTVEENRQRILIEKIQSGELDLFSYFQNSVLIGDSRVKAFEEYQFLPESRVLAELGYTILNIPEFEEAVETLRPENIFISYGVNDIESRIGAANGDYGFGEIFQEKIEELLAKSPDSKVFVNAILPVGPSANLSVEERDLIQNYNRQIEEMCKKNKWYFIDNAKFTQDSLEPYYETDDVHFKASFLPIWAENMMEAATDV